MSQLVAEPISGKLVDYSALYEDFTIRVDVFFNLNSVNYSFLSTYTLSGFDVTPSSLPISPLSRPTRTLLS